MADDGRETPDPLGKYPTYGSNTSIVVLCLQPSTGQVDGRDLYRYGVTPLCHPPCELSRSITARRARCENQQLFDAEDEVNLEAKIYDAACGAEPGALRPLISYLEETTGVATMRAVSYCFSPAGIQCMMKIGESIDVGAAVKWLSRGTHTSGKICLGCCPMLSAFLKANTAP